MPEHLSSRERMLNAIRGQEVDYVPCAFMSFSAMRGRCQDPYEVVERELEMGLNSWLFVPPTWRNQRPNHPDLRGLPVRLPPEVRTELWSEDVPGESFPVLHKEYHTPAGTLTTLVRRTDDWPHGNSVPFMDDYQIPRAIKPLVASRADLAVLRTLLLPPSSHEIAAFRAEVERARAFSARRGILIASGWGVGADMASWLCGLQNLMLLVMDDPGFVEELLEVIGTWNEQRMRVILESGVDLYIRRGWYESAQFWSPKLYRRFLLPQLQRETKLAHEHGVPFGYNMTTGLLPMLDNLLETGIDVLLGLDPIQQGADPLRAARDRLGGRVCLWGGVNGAITVEEGTASDVREAVHHVLDVMHDTNGFILSPVDNITEITRNTWRNVDVLIKTWQELR
jgi:hypothetical protein